jgi:cell division transport system ATP-binding protein
MLSKAEPLDDKGEWVFLVGPSGAGKSTLLKLLYGAASPAHGEVLVEGRDVSRMAPRDIPFLRRRIGVIFQDFLLMPQKTVWENVAYALQVIGTPQKLLAREVPRALETVGLHDKATMRPGQLSGGEQQRVAIARAIVNRPNLVLADEPTGNLDPETGADIIAVLKKINDEGTTIVMATHDRAVVNEARRRVVRLAEGRLFSDEALGTYHAEDKVLQQPPTAPSSTSVVASAPVPSTSLAPAAAASPEKEAKNGHSNGAVEIESNQEAPPERKRWLPRASAPSTLGTSIMPKEDSSALDEPKAPLGSPENPLVQFDKPASRPRRAADDR